MTVEQKWPKNKWSTKQSHQTLSIFKVEKAQKEQPSCTKSLEAVLSKINPKRSIFKEHEAQSDLVKPWAQWKPWGEESLCAGQNRKTGWSKWIPSLEET